MLGWDGKASKLRHGNHAFPGQRQQEADGLHGYHLAEDVSLEAQVLG